MALDSATLTRWMAGNVPGFVGPVTVAKFGTGQSNPTYSVSAPSGRYVLRRKPPGQLLKSAHAVDREFRVMKALAATPVPVPEVLALCEDDSVVGSMFYIMRHVEGRIFWDPALPELEKQDRGKVYDAMNAALAALHSVDVAAVGLADFGKAGNYYERQFTRWSDQYRASETAHHPAMAALMAWLRANMVGDDGRVSLVHGDYRIDNMIFHPAEPRILALLDWELSTLGHPFADLAYQCMQWRMPPGAELRGLAGLDRAALGLPTEEEYVAAYARRMGITRIDHWPFYLAFSFFRLAAILQGVVKRAIDGNASNPGRAEAMAARVPQLAEMAMEVVG